MKKIISFITGLLMSSSTLAVEPFNEVDAAVEYIRSFNGKAEELQLPIYDEMNDQFGMNMAIITDAILAKEFEPNGFEQKQGYRVYVYK